MIIIPMGRSNARDNRWKFMLQALCERASFGATGRRSEGLLIYDGAGRFGGFGEDSYLIPSLEEGYSLRRSHMWATNRIRI